MSDRINTDVVDMYVDLSYGVLLIIGISTMILMNEYLVAVAFGTGIMLGYAVHVGWRMARFDPEAASRIEQAVDEKVEAHVDDMREDVEKTVEDTVEEEVGQAQEEIEDAVEEAVEETVNDSS